ncbi:hypothetical protein FOA43_002183 [Brettanomyces nanus]|uniref:ENTH domain-containing protein n=1 Tax=Eeniella nana TaxID=13502 RepID=A0A875RUQ9_EENNA|nr:uncharacterized protein FOA43_002183 [Brettanomyces nanus]QPG74847.1 hypothetical protein FOA43_002183 [Brettanomyces nanus]
MSFYGLRKYTRKIQNALTGYSDLENLIRESTNTDTWGPTSQQKRQLSNWILSYTSFDQGIDFNDIDLAQNVDPQYTHQISQYTINFITDRILEYSQHKRGDSIYQKLKKNLVTKGYEFQIIVKCLNLLEYLLLNCFRLQGSTTTFDIADDMRMHLSVIDKLKSYHAKIAYDGLVLVHEKQVRQLADHLSRLLQDDGLLQKEREKFHPDIKTTGDNYVDQAEELEDENGWADQFGDLQSADEGVDEQKPPIVDLLSDFNGLEISQLQTTEPLPNVSNSIPVHQISSEDHPTPVKTSPKQRDLFDDLLSDFKSTNPR